VIISHSPPPESSPLKGQETIWGNLPLKGRKLGWEILTYIII